MRDEDLLGLIRDTPWIAELLDRFDFDLDRVVNGPPEPVQLPGGVPLEMVAGDASGGAYLLAGAAGANRPVVYVSSEGQGGLIAADLRTALALVVGLSSIHDAFSVPVDADGGRALRTWLARTDDEVREDLPELDTDRARLREALDLPAADGLLEALHAAAADEAYRPVSEAGDEYESMLR